VGVGVVVGVVVGVGVGVVVKCFVPVASAAALAFLSSQKVEDMQKDLGQCNETFNFNVVNNI
jgi:hypothetical protein